MAQPPKYDFDYGEGGPKLIRIEEVDHGAPDDTGYAFDVFNIDNSGKFVFRHNGVPLLGQTKTGFTDSGTSIALTFDTTAKSGSLLLVGVFVNESGGTHTINSPSGYDPGDMGGNEIADTKRFNSFIKISNGTETGVTVTINGGAGEFCVIFAELEGYRGIFKKLTNANTALGGGSYTTASVFGSNYDIENVGNLAWLGTNIATHSSPTDNFVQQVTVASTNMRLTLFGRLLNVIDDPDLSVTISPAVSGYIMRCVAFTPVLNLIAGDPVTGLVTIRSAVMPRWENLLSVPNTPGNNETVLYVRFDPDSTLKNQPVIMHDNGVIHEVPFVSEDGPQWFSGTGTPEGVVTANIGAQYVRTDGGAGTSFYVKETGTGNTGWVGK